MHTILCTVGEHAQEKVVGLFGLLAQQAYDDDPPLLYYYNKNIVVSL